MKIKWNAPESMDGERTMKFHAFTEAVRKTPYIGEKYTGNKALCNRRFGIIDGDEKFVKIDDIEDELLIKEEACKTCLRIYESLKHLREKL